MEDEAEKQQILSELNEYLKEKKKGIEICLI